MTGALRRALLAAALLAACAGEEVETRERSAAERGAALFSDPRLSRNEYNAFSCATCHATSEHPAADRILPGASLDGVVARPTYWGGQEDDLLRSVNQCLRFFMIDSAGLDRSSASAADLFAFLASRPRTTVAAVPFTVVASVKDVAVGDAGRGQQVYLRACRGCHGDLHTGAGQIGRATVLPEDTIAEHAKYGPLELRLTAIEKIRHGSFLGYGGQMPPFSLEVLSDADLGDVLSYLGFLP